MTSAESKQLPYKVHLEGLRPPSRFFEQLPTWSSLRVGADGPLPADRFLDELEDHLVAAGQAEGTFRVESNRGLHIYSQLTPETLRGFGDCQEATSDSAGATRVPDLLEVLAYDVERLAAANRHLRSVSIVIPDTGLRTTGAPPFSSRRLVWRTERELAANRPQPGYENHHHGTYVATLALGGLDFMQTMDGLDLDLRVWPYRLVAESPPGCGGPLATCSYYEVRPDRLTGAFDKARFENAVVNLSVGQEERLAQIEDHLNEQSGLLFVAAAGNDGESLVNRSVYPARYGGDHKGRENLITVGALDTDGTRANFSNYGADFVDIAAPGCWQPVLEYDSDAGAFRQVEVSGTSFAAPQVSFAAALLRAVWPHAQPREVKRRILTSATISPRLQADEIADRRELNVVKALAIFQDVVEARIDGEDRIFRGEVDPGKGIWRFCDGGLEFYRKPQPSRSVLRKIAVIPGHGGEPKLFLYSVDPGGQLRSHECPAGDFEIRFHDDFTGWTYTFGVDSLVDAVFAEPFS